MRLIIAVICLFVMLMNGTAQGKTIVSYSSLKEFYRMLKPGGILSVSELAGDPDKLTAEEIRALAEKRGFTCSQLVGKERNFTINFKKTAGIL